MRLLPGGLVQVLEAILGMAFMFLILVPEHLGTAAKAVKAAFKSV